MHTHIVTIWGQQYFTSHEGALSTCTLTDTEVAEEAVTNAYRANVRQIHTQMKFIGFRTEESSND